MDERLSKAEIRKDAVQNTVEAAAGTVGQVATIITAAVKDVAGTVGGFATELFEIRDQARRAAAAQESPQVSPADAGLQVDPDAIAPVSPDVHPDPDAPTA
jgi:hypothetical protein